MQPSVIGKRVDPDTALSYTSVYACVSVISETLASLPWFVYERLSEGKQRATEHPLYTLLHDQPNPYMTSYQFRLLLQSHVLLWGNGYAEIEWDRARGVVKALWPLDPSRTKRVVKDGKSLYEVQLPNHGTATLKEGQVFHVYGLGDGFSGYSRIRLHREAIALGLATEEFGSRFFANGARPSGVLETDGALSPEAKKNLKDSWNAANGGLTKQQRVAVLEAGVTYKQIGVPPDDAQFLATRKYQKEEVASIFRVPLHLIQSLDHATNNNIEHQGLDFVINTMRPYLVMWEQEGQRVMFVQPFFNEFMVDGLLRGDIQSRYAAYAVGRNWGWLSADDIRERENMNPLPDGKGAVYLQPLNMVEAGTDLSPKETNLRSLDTRNQTVRSETPNYAMLRHRTAQSMIPAFVGSYERIVKREKSNVLRAAKKHMSERTEDSFLLWLEEFYRDFPEYVAKELRAVIQALTGAITPLASEQVGFDDPDVREVMEQHLQFTARRYAESSRQQLGALIRDNVEEDAYEVVEQRVSEWEETRPGKESADTVIKTSNWVARAIFFIAGKRLVWRALGAETCPYCQELDGRTVGREEPFVGVEDVLNSEDGQMILNKPAFAPPLHRGCVCQIDPE